jgi:tRNA (guanine9-N1)-methyltransferase
VRERASQCVGLTLRGAGRPAVAIVPLLPTTRTRSRLPGPAADAHKRADLPHAKFSSVCAPRACIARFAIRVVGASLLDVSRPIFEPSNPWILPVYIDRIPHIACLDMISSNLSKNQMKKLARKQRMLEARPEKRRIEREKKRLKKLKLAEARKEQKGSVDSHGHGYVASNRNPSRTPMCNSKNKFKVVIDLDFEEFMTDDEIAKAAKQCKHVYGMNRKSENPCQLYMSSVKGKIRDRFAITCNGFENWDAHISQLDYIDMLISPESEHAAEQAASDKIRQNIVYLTGDADESLPDSEEILKDESKIFVIGGLVDHNRHKSLCFTRAKERQIKTAKLPISENLKLCQRHILSTVTVFDILLNVLGGHKSWRDSLIAAIPKRKIHPSEFANEENHSSAETDVDSKIT